MVKYEIVLGYEISKKGIEVDRAKIEVIAKLSHAQMREGYSILLRTRRFLLKIYQGF